MGGVRAFETGLPHLDLFTYIGSFSGAIVCKCSFAANAPGTLREPQGPTNETMFGVGCAT